MFHFISNLGFIDIIHNGWVCFFLFFGALFIKYTEQPNFLILTVYIFLNSSSVGWAGIIKGCMYSKPFTLERFALERGSNPGPLDQ